MDVKPLGKGRCKGRNRGMATHTRFKKFLGGIAAAIALTFAVAPAAAADDADKNTSSKGGYSAQKDTGWGR
jgi:hypothetical protein